jgi:Rod binding domain-containing protein
MALPGIPVTSAAAISLPVPTVPTDLGLTSPPKPAPTDAERARFKKAATEFESFFLYYMLKTMRQAVPKGGLLNSKAADSYMSLFDQEVANLAAKRGGLGLQKTIENQFFPPSVHRLSFDTVTPIIESEEEGR